VKIELRFPSSHVFLGVPDAVLQELGSELPFTQTELDELSTSVIEACTNALEHGNGLEAERPVQVEIDFDSQRIQVTVHDQGRGFDFENIDFSQEPADLMQERGRGIYIMYTYCDELSFSRSNGGFAVRLVKTHKGEPAPDGA
jgi:serine/threonine-protein kinase RsbW